MTLSRRSFLHLSAAAIASPWLPRESADDLGFLRQMVIDLLEAARVKPGSNGPPDWKIKNTTGFALVTPGRKGYPAFWVRDFSMATDSGLVPSEEILNHLRLLAKVQNGASVRKLKSGATVPPYAIPDHVNFDGWAVFYPGTYSAGEDQGAGPWGKLPPIDDHYEFIHIASVLAKQDGKKEFLKEQIAGFSLLERLQRAFDAPESDPDTGIVFTHEPNRAVGFGFCDSIVLTGNLLYPTLLRWRAAKELHELTNDAKYKNIALKIATHIGETFEDKNSGWLLAATEVGKQPDVWGTLYALHLGLLSGKAPGRALATVLEDFKGGKIAQEGAVRHVPTNRDFSAKSAWESTYTAKGIYQNGSYWHTPTGWLIEALMKVDAKAGREAFRQYIAHLRQLDYRRGSASLEAPWECFATGTRYFQNGAYLASAAWPYAALKNLPGLTAN